MGNSTIRNGSEGNGDKSAGFGINLERLRDSLSKVSSYGFNPADNGIYRPSFSDADMQARQWLIAEMKASGLTAWMDGVGNVFGRWEIGDGPAVLVGSHLDSVPQGGRLDGTLGVLTGLECVRSLMEQGFQPEHPIEILATSEEEGRFGGMLGSQALAGVVSEDWLKTTKDNTGLSLRDAMARQGLDAMNALTIKRDPASVKAFLELHIEQGPVLDEMDIPVGVVTGISGCANWSVTLTGRPNHAGTTPMDMRADAFAGLAQFAATIPSLVNRHGTEQSRVTVGKVDITPNYPHTIAGEAHFAVILRDMDKEVMEKLAEACRAQLDISAKTNGLTLQIEEVSWLDPQHCDSTIIDLLKAQADRLGIPSLVMPSGAGHDTQFMAQIAPAGLIFVPSIGGISHAPDEDTDWNDIEKGTRLLANAIAELAS